MTTTTKCGDEALKTTSEKIIPVVKEHLVIDTRKRETGRITVTKRTETETVDVPLPTVLTTYREERVPRNRIVESIPETRTEGNPIIIPVVQEETVVTKRLVLVEEIHLKQEVRRTESIETVSLARDAVSIQREKDGPPPSDGSEPSASPPASRN